MFAIRLAAFLLMLSCFLVKLDACIFSDCADACAVSHVQCTCPLRACTEMVNEQSSIDAAVVSAAMPGLCPLELNTSIHTRAASGNRLWPGLCP